MDFDLTTNKGQSEALMWCAAQCTNDPLKFAQIAFPWGKGTLANFTGPDKWQAEVLTSMRDRLQSGEAWQHVIQDATASGHGTGKSCLVSWIILWALCTYPDTRGVVTANTESQLRTKTFAELAKWHGLCIFKDWFVMSAMSLVSRQKGA